MRILNVITSNPGKLVEFQRALGNDFELVHLPVGYTEVQTDSLEEVVERGIDELLSRGLDDFIIDDSGLFVDSLSGFPGVYSAYAFKTLGNAGLLRLMEDERNARFRCCIGCHTAEAGRLVVCAECPGSITRDLRGTDGFGFDPVFVPDGQDLTFAEMGLADKNHISHRGLAITAFARELGGRLDR